MSLASGSVQSLLRPTLRRGKPRRKGRSRPKRSGDPQKELARGAPRGSLGPAVRDRGRVEPQLSNLLLRAGIILVVYSVREQKLRLFLRFVALQGHHQSGAKQYALFPAFSY